MSTPWGQQGRRIRRAVPPRRVRPKSAASNSICAMTTAAPAEIGHVSVVDPPAIHYQIPLPLPVAVKFDRDRDAGHRFVVSLLPDNLSREVRKDTFTTRRPGPGHIEVVTAAEIAGIEGTPVVSVEVGQSVRLNMTLEAVRAKGSPLEPAVVETLRAQGIRWPNPRSRIDDEELPAWIADRLHNNGWVSADIEQLTRRSVSRRHANMHLAECVVAATVADPVLANRSLRLGIGRGRSFGAGMVTPI